jgi:predicted nuclease of predicted toxin-antitoxin system
VRLLLDEHLSPEIARQLRARGHDVIAAGERDDLRGRSDRVHFASLSDQQRAIATRDVGDFRPLLAQALRSGTQTYGLVCIPRRFSLSRKAVGRLVRALEALLETHPAPDAAIRRGGEIWLDDPQED